MNVEHFLNKYAKNFSGNNEHKVVFAMGDDVDDATLRVRTVLSIFNAIADYLLSEKSIWVVLVVWDVDRGTIKNLEKCGFNFSNANFVVPGKEDDNPTPFNFSEAEDAMYYLYYEKYDFQNLEPLIQAVAAYELEAEPSANVGCYILSFSESDILINLYDDRGMEVLSNDKILIDNLKVTFSEYLLR